MFLYLIDLTMQPLQKRCPHGVCTASRRAIKQIGHSYLLSKGGSNSTSYPCVSSVKELGGFPVPLLTLTLSSFAPTLQALAMAAQQPLSTSRAPQLLSLYSKLIVANQVLRRNALQDDKKMRYFKIVQDLPFQSRTNFISDQKHWNSGADLVLLKITSFVFSWFLLSIFFTYLVVYRKEHCILSA